MIKFNKHHVADSETGAKAKVWYSLDNRVDKRKCVTLYAKDYARTLRQVFPSEYKNDSDSMSDYNDSGRVVFFEDHAQYSAARIRAEANAVR